ncbi:MAG: hypothetical protein O3A47_07890 [Chloroflexi bacterium]|nr:hypothetical protein [Chloroflexota bacterium]
MSNRRSVLRRGYSWPVAGPDPKLLRLLGVNQESTKIAFDSRGEIIYKRRGGGDGEAWADVFRQLADSTIE